MERYACKYDSEGADELIIIDTVASLYGRENLIEIVKRIASEVFIPITAGGGIRSLEDIFSLLDVGVDKICMNTAAVERPKFIEEASRVFGQQCIVLSVEAARGQNKGWQVFTENGREPKGLDVVEWVKRAEELGAGEVLITSIDQDGTRKGFDIELGRAVGNTVSVPVIISGGAGSSEHVIEAIRKTSCPAVALASLFHYGLCSIPELKQKLSENKLSVRMVHPEKHSATFEDASTDRL